jgi:hypothetical protein
MVITRVGPLSVAKVAGLLYAVIGLLAGGFISLIAMSGFGAGADDYSPFAAMFGVGAVILLPIFYGCLGFVATLIMTWLFNIIVGITGGVEVDAR